MYRTGSFVAEEDEFRKRYVRKKTQTAREGSVEGLLQPESRMESVVERAWQYVPVLEAASKKDEQANDSDHDMFMAIDPATSSPVHEY